MVADVAPGCFGHDGDREEETEEYAFPLTLKPKKGGSEFGSGTSTPQISQPIPERPAINGGGSAAAAAAMSAPQES